MAKSGGGAKGEKEGSGQDLADELEVVRGTQRAMLITCAVVAGGAVALTLLIFGAISIFVAGKNVGPARLPDDQPVKVVNRCDSAIRVGWVLSDSAVPFTAADAAGYFPPEERSVQPSHPTNPTQPIPQGGDAQLGVGRVEAGGSQRILLIKAASDSQASVTSWKFRPSDLSGWPSAPVLPVEGAGCAPAGLNPLPLG